MNDIIDWTPANMLEISLDQPDDFLKIKETLSRIGVSSKREHNTLYQSVHILHKQGRYFLPHFKEMFLLDGKPSSLTLDDIARRNTIAVLLQDWGLLRIVNFGGYTDVCSLKQIKIISHKDKSDWVLLTKYSIGQVKKK
jgi:hypothetical protein